MAGVARDAAVETGVVRGEAGLEWRTARGVWSLESNPALAGSNWRRKAPIENPAADARSQGLRMRIGQGASPASVGERMGRRRGVWRSGCRGGDAVLRALSVKQTLVEWGSWRQSR